MIKYGGWNKSRDLRLCIVEWIGLVVEHQTRDLHVQIKSSFGRQAAYHNLANSQPRSEWVPGQESAWLCPE